MYEEMWRASENQEFEKAAKIRNDIKSLEATALKQRIAFPSQTRDKDVVTIARDAEVAAAIGIPGTRRQCCGTREVHSGRSERKV